MTVREEGTMIAGRTETPDQRGNWTISQTGVELKDGKKYEITAEYEDGKSASSGTSIRFTADGVCSLTGIAEEFKDADTVISGRTDANATVYLKISGTEILPVQADGNGEFRFANLSLNYGDRLEIYAEDPLGNRSGTVTRTVETAKEKLWVRMDQPKADMKVTRYLSTQGIIFSHEEVQVFYTLTSADGSYHEEFQITGEDLGEMNDSDLNDMVEKERKDQPDLQELYSIRYGYDISKRFDIQQTDIKNGDYKYALYVSGQEEPVYSATLHLADPEKEEKAEKPKDNVNSYAKNGVRFIAGLDELIMDPFPDNGMLLTGWIWAPEGMLGKNAEIVVYYPMNGRRYPTPLSARDIQDYDGTDKIVYRNIAAEKQDLVKEYGQPDSEKAGFVVWLPIGSKFHVLKPGTHEIEIWLRDTDDNEWKIGTYEITLQEGISGLNGEARARKIVEDWESQRPAE